jgi:hypothetical protein
MNEKDRGLIGMTGTAIAYVAQHYSEAVSGIAATATAVYMIMHAIREFKKYSDEKNNKK